MNKNHRNIKDNYIYSIYEIQNKNNKFTCTHIGDVTQKNSKMFSVKSEKFTSSVSPYYVDISNNCLKVDYIHNISGYEWFLANKKVEKTNI